MGLFVVFDFLMLTSAAPEPFASVVKATIAATRLA